MHAMLDFFEDPITLGTVYAGLILLVMLWAMALLTRRVRVLQSNLETVQSELKLLNEAMQDLAHGQAPQRQESIDSVLGSSPPVDDIPFEMPGARPAAPAAPKS
jgi:hypothetical protein